MYAKLTGTVDEITLTHVVMDVGGVGYLVATSARTRGRLDLGAVTRLLIETHVREDAINLYGFIDVEEQAWFRLLTSVQGVGAKVGLALLSACTPGDLALALAAGDKAILTRADGVGPKLATRIVTELKDKAPEFRGVIGAAVSLTPAGKSVKGGAGVPDAPGTAATGTGGGGTSMVDADAISALVNLGYGRAEAFSAVTRVRADRAIDTVADMIKYALNDLAGRNAA